MHLLQDDTLYLVLALVDAKTARACRQVSRRVRDTLLDVPGHCIGDCAIVVLQCANDYKVARAKLRCNGAHEHRRSMFISLAGLAEHQVLHILTLICTNLVHAVSLHLIDDATAKSVTSQDVIHHALTSPAPKLSCFSYVFARKDEQAPVFHKPFFAGIAPRLQRMDIVCAAVSPTAVDGGTLRSLRQLSITHVDPDMPYPWWILQSDSHALLPLLRRVDLRINAMEAATPTNYTILPHLGMHISASAAAVQRLINLGASAVTVIQVRQLFVQRPVRLPTDSEDMHALLQSHLNLLSSISATITMAPFYLVVSQAAQGVVVQVKGSAGDEMRGAWLPQSCLPADSPAPPLWRAVFPQNFHYRYLVHLGLDATIIARCWPDIPMGERTNSLSVLYSHLDELESLAVKMRELGSISWPALKELIIDYQPVASGEDTAARGFRPLLTPDTLYGLVTSLLWPIPHTLRVVCPGVQLLSQHALKQMGIDVTTVSNSTTFGPRADGEDGWLAPAAGTVWKASCPPYHGN